MPITNNNEVNSKSPSETPRSAENESPRAKLLTRPSSSRYLITRPLAQSAVTVPKETNPLAALPEATKNIEDVQTIAIQVTNLNSSKKIQKNELQTMIKLLSDIE